MKIMKHSAIFSTGSYLFLILIFLMAGKTVNGQETSKASPQLPDNINKIVSVSCMPCHSSSGGMLSRTKLNFTEWTDYSAEKQKKKAAQMYKELNKNAMPPKDARETNPDIIPTKEQIEIIKSWADSF
jgi:cytochrome c5